MSAVPKLRLVERALEPFHDRSPVDEIDWDEIEREHRFAGFVILSVFVAAILAFAGVCLWLMSFMGSPL